MPGYEKQLRNIRLGSLSWCVLKTTVIDPEKKDSPEFLVHLARGYVKSKGITTDDETGKTVTFVEIAGQRVKASHVFKTYVQAASVAESMIDDQIVGLKALPQQP